MKTSFETPKEYADAFLNIIEETSAVGKKRPEAFRKIMKENRGNLQRFSPFAPTEDGLEPKNPLVVALGDSVTAGHFEFAGNPEEIFAKINAGEIDEDWYGEITDARCCYLEQFRGKLIDYYQQTSVSTINSGIAGDNVFGMNKRLQRDVIRYQPDLVIINASLNWAEECGDVKVYQRELTEIIDRTMDGTGADIILMTPNMEIPGPFANPICSLQSRVEVIRELADKKGLCLADTYLVWEKYVKAGYPLEAMLANGTNHPSKIGHEGYAEVLMQLIRN